MAEQTEQLRPV